LGRYWNVADETQRREYMTLFEKMIVDAYAGRFAEYSGETFKVAGVRPDGDVDSHVTTQIVRPSGPPVNVEWRVRKTGATYKIIDVVVEGVSMGVTQRSEFASVIQTNGGQVDGLLKALRAKVTAGAG
ncbi:ABC transporter substrate-binding protein, partial [bacterium]|nr:ABC transporter substrate-binding protein [bacterium]